MPVLIVSILAAVALGIGLSIWLGFIPVFGAVTLIRIRNGSLFVQRGQMRGHAKDAVADILQSKNVANGFIAITGDNKVYFSRQIPGEIHQRLRNVLLNQ